MSQLSRTPAANAAATATQSLSTLLANLRASMQRLPDAWAHRVSTANKAYLAAVMGPSLTRSCRESAEWSISEGVENDSASSIRRHMAHRCPRPQSLRELV